MFKKGDKVKRINNDNGGVKIGTAGVIEGVEKLSEEGEEAADVLWAEHTRSQVSYVRNLKKIEEKKMYTTYDNNLLEAGDRVVLTGNHYTEGKANPRIGSEWECEGTIDRARANVRNVTVGWDNGRQNGYLIERQQLSLVKKHTAPVYKTTAKAPTIEALLKAAGSCKEARGAISKFTRKFGIMSTPNEDDLLAFLNKRSKRLAWAIEHGFVEKVAEEVFYKRGDKFKLHNTYYALNWTGARWRDIGLVNMDTGCRFSNSFNVQNFNKITRAEFNLMCGGAIGDFKPVKLIFVEDPE